MSMIIDFHNHIYPEKIAMKATKSIGEFYNVGMCKVGTTDTLVETGEKAGIGKYLVQSVATTAAQVHSINDFISSQCRQEERFVGFGTLHPDVEDIPAEVDRMISLGLRGVKLHPDFQKFNIDDKCALPIYEACEGRMPILFHTGDFRYTYSHPERVLNILKQFPDLTVIAAHFGGWGIWDEAVPYMMRCSCYMDTSSTFGFIGADRMKRLILKYGPDRLVFGTDFPMWSSVDEVNNLQTMGLSDDWLEKIFYSNARTILKL